VPSTGLPAECSAPAHRPGPGWATTGAIPRVRTVPCRARAVLKAPRQARQASTRWIEVGRTCESDLAGVREGHLASLFTRAGLGRTHVTTLSVRVRHASFDDWWRPFTLGVGPAGAFVAFLTPDRRVALRDQCGQLLPAAAVAVTAVAWAASGRA
jgi:hypothetical protein